jgi:hypothetical protein
MNQPYLTGYKLRKPLINPTPYKLLVIDTLAVKLGCDGRFLLLLLLTRHNPKTMPPSDRIHKRFSLTSTDCPDGAEFYLWAELTLAVKLLCCLTRHHYIFKGDICSEVQRSGRFPWYFTRFTAFCILAKSLESGNATALVSFWSRFISR